MNFFLRVVLFLCYFSRLVAHDFARYDDQPTWGDRLKHHAVHVSKIAVALPIVPFTTLGGAGLGVLSMPFGAAAGVLILDFRLYGPQPEQTNRRVFGNACKGAWSGFSMYTQDGAKFGWKCADVTVNKITHLFE